MKNRNLAIPVLLIVWFAQCMDSEDPELPYFLGAYTPADLGIIQTEAEKQALIPVISKNEREVASEVIEFMQEQGLADEKVLKTASKEHRAIVQGIQLTAEEMQQKVEAEEFGGNWGGERFRSLEDTLQREAAAAEDYYSGQIQAFNTMSDEELLALRTNNTIALIMLRLQQDYGATDGGLPVEVLELYRAEAVKFRHAINEELIAREVKIL